MLVLPRVLLLQDQYFLWLLVFIGMRAATSANVRTTMAAKRNGEHAAFMISFLAVVLWDCSSYIWFIWCGMVMYYWGSPY